jgi:protein gp37
MGTTAIEWTATVDPITGTVTPGKVWNPVTGCNQISPGCDHCYALALSKRYWPTQYPRNEDGSPRRFEQVLLHPDRLAAPFSWRKSVRVFVNSMSDLFHEDVPDDFIVEVFAVMALASEHTFQVLTKRPRRMAAFLSRLYEEDDSLLLRIEAVMGRYGAERGWCKDEIEEWPLPNVWLGTSVELDRFAWRANHYLAQTPAAVRFVSAEPLLGPLPSLDVGKLDWLITGGESGIGHRPLDLDWVRDLRDRSLAAGTAFFHKQGGGLTPKAGGRLLDGREWSQFPAVRAVAAA